jgi:tetratricopeptide (TPR) repeat protein
VSQQLGYSISKVLDAETLEEGKILELIHRQIGDSTILDGESIVLEPERRTTDSRHELEPGIYKIEFTTVPPMASYFTLDREQELTIALVRSGQGIDLYDRAHLALGNSYYDSGEIEKALQEYQKVLDFDSNNVDAHLNMGIIYDDILLDKTKAAEHYKAYLELQGPRQEEVRTWLRNVRGEPTREEELQEQVRQRDEEEARKELERLAEEEAERLRQEREEALEVYEEILTRNSQIRELSEEEVISGDVIRVTVSAETLDSEAEDIATDVGNRIRRLLERTPREILVYREDEPQALAAQAVYDSAQQQYIIAE